MCSATQPRVRRLATAGLVCLLVLPGAAVAKGKRKGAHSASARTVSVKKKVALSGLYTASVSFKRPRHGSNRITLRVENAKSRKLTVHPSRIRKRLIVKVDTSVTDGSISLTA